MKRLLVGILIVLLGTQVSAQDFNKGVNAYIAGDYATAFKEWKHLAEKGNAEVQDMIAEMYLEGRGVLADPREALKWFRLSAEQGNMSAQLGLGNMYKFGIGVLKDQLSAHMWYNISAANGNKTAGRFRDEDEANMSSKDISKATAMARECMKSDYKKCGY